MRFKGKLSGLKLDSNFTKTLDQALQIQNRQAAREWLRAVILLVKVWTGESKGSIKFAEGTNGFLGQYLNVSIPIDPVETRPGKGPETGKGRYNFTSARHIYGFFFRTDVIQYEINEFFVSVSPTSPWNSLKAGAAAYRAYIRNNLPNLPKINRAITKTTIEF